MDPDESFPMSAAFPPPAPAATPIPGPKIFQLSPLPGNIYNVECYYYAPLTDITKEDFAALFASANHYGHPIAVYNCYNLAAFQAAHPTAIICPFLEVPPAILRWGQELLSASNDHYTLTASSAANHAQATSPLGSSSSASLLSGVSQGADPPSLSAATRVSGSGCVSLSGVSFGCPPPHFSCRPNSDGVEVPSAAMGGSSAAMGGSCSSG
jgi:hypothetical protein